MNQDRLIKIIEDMQECISDINECVYIFESNENNSLILKLAKSSLRQLFVSYHTILEDLSSILLKELKKFKVGITLHESFIIFKDFNLINEDTFIFLEKSRLIRNRISHRYKEPTHEELLKHIKQYKNHFNIPLNLAKPYLQ